MPPAASVLVTGTSRGFGFLIARTLARAGHRVFAGMRDPSGRNADRRAALLADVAGLPGTIEVVELDVTSDASVDRAIGAATAASGLDVVVNNAGVAAAGVLESFTADQLRDLFDVNLFGVHRVTRAALPALRAAGRGCLIHVSSTLGRYGIPFFGAYVASKFALEALADAYRYELAPLGVESVLVEPGTFPTGMLGRMVSPADPARAGGYGAQVDLMAAMGAGLEAAMSASDAPDAQDVADAVARLVATPAGERPPRTIVDRQAHAVVDALNRAHDDAQAQLFGAMGLAHLLATKPTERG